MDMSGHFSWADDRVYSTCLHDTTWHTPVAMAHSGKTGNQEQEKFQAVDRHHKILVSKQRNDLPAKGLP